MTDSTRVHAIPEDQPQVITSQLDGNAFSIIGEAQRQMRNHGYPKELVDQYREEATSGDYMNLLRVTSEYVELV